MKKAPEIIILGLNYVSFLVAWQIHSVLPDQLIVIFPSTEEFVNDEFLLVNKLGLSEALSSEPLKAIIENLPQTIQSNNLCKILFDYTKSSNEKIIVDSNEDYQFNLIKKQYPLSTIFISTAFSSLHKENFSSNEETLSPTFFAEIRYLVENAISLNNTMRKLHEIAEHFSETSNKEMAVTTFLPIEEETYQKIATQHVLTLSHLKKIDPPLHAKISSYFNSRDIFLNKPDGFDPTTVRITAKQYSARIASKMAEISAEADKKTITFFVGNAAFNISLLENLLIHARVAVLLSDLISDMVRGDVDQHEAARRYQENVQFVLKSFKKMQILSASGNSFSRTKTVKLLDVEKKIDEAPSHDIPSFRLFSDSRAQSVLDNSAYFQKPSLSYKRKKCTIL